MIASEKSGRGAEQHRGRSAFPDSAVADAQNRLLELGGVNAESRTQVVDAVALHYLESGSGETLLMLHGAGGGAANWYRLMAPLSQRFRVVAVDLPGFGLSDSIEPQRPLGRQIAGLIFNFLKKIDVGPAHIVGTSFGGLVAARLAELSNPRSLVLIDAAGLWREASFQLKTACMPIFQWLALKQTRAGARIALERILIRKRLPQEHEQALVDYIYASAARTDIRKLGRAYALFGGWRGQSEVLNAVELKALADRTLIIWGEQDRFLPAPRSQLEQALAAGVQVHMIPGVGHSPNWEAPDEVLMAMKVFWDGLGDEQKEHS
ncbi:MAG: alpha/beta fold hydrolase [Gemmatimonadota bacterium]